MDNMDDWVKVIGAVGGALVLVIGALGAWAIKIWEKRIESTKLAREDRLKELELEHRLRKADTEEVKRRQRDITAEKDELIDKQQTDLEIQRQEIHEMANQMHALAMEAALCKQERDLSRRQIHALAEACRQHNIAVAMPYDLRPVDPIIPPKQEGK